MQNGELIAHVVGEDFKAAAANKEIKQLAEQLELDFDEDINYCKDTTAALDIIETLGSVAYLKPTESGKHVCIFDFLGSVYVTKEFNKEALAAAAAALHLMRERK